MTATTKKKAIKNATTREHWLNTVATAIVPLIEEATDKKVPKFRVSIGFPSRRALATSRKRMAECWPTNASSDGTIEIFVSPLHSSDLAIAASIAHELIHSVQKVMDHKSFFAHVAYQIGLKGKPTSTSAGIQFKTFITPVLKEVGPFPGGAMVHLSKSSHYSKQTTRLIKLKCVNPECGMIIRTTRKWIDKVGEPRCNCQHPFDEEL